MSLNNIDKSKLVLVNEDDVVISDVALETKEIGYYQDAWNRFKKNPVSLVAFVIICILFFFVLVGPHMKVYTKPANPADSSKIGYLPPKVPFLEKLGFMDGSKTIKKGKNFLLTLYNSPFGEGIILSGMPEELIDNDPSNDYLYDEVYELEVKVDMYKYVNYITSYLDESNTDTSVKKIFSKEQFEAALADNLIIDIISVSPDGNTYTVRVDFFKYALNQTPEDTYFWFGTDRDGRDLFTLLWDGARISLIMAISVVIINAIVGLTIGAIAGYYGGTFDLLFDRFVEILGGIPFMAVLTLLIIRFGSAMGVIIFAFTITGWMGSYSMARMQFYRFKNREYILAARTLAASDSRIMFKHIFPNALGYMVTSFALAIPSFVFTEASYAYLGIINYSNAISVGMLLEQGQQVMGTDPHMLIFPSFYIAILMITFNLFGNGLRDAFNPSLRGTE
ncbi:MAG: ABC transporter permease [Acholeplasma sp.]|jgi:oligopeptide transport system permease protein|nr:ABC transporter permease [Acholeplasma sp.]